MAGNQDSQAGIVETERVALGGDESNRDSFEYPFNLTCTPKAVAEAHKADFNLQKNDEDRLKYELFF